MTTNIQVRGVDEELAAAAKRRAEDTARSLSAYVRDLIEEDLRHQRALDNNRALMAEIESDPDQPLVSREATRAALLQARKDMGIE